FGEGRGRTDTPSRWPHRHAQRMKTDQQSQPPAALVIFGASGDLTRRLLAPAIAHLSRDGAISPEFAIVGIARTSYSDADFRKRLDEGAREFTPREQGRPGELPAVVRYVCGDFGDPALYASLRGVLEDIESKRGGQHNRIFYLATPPEADPEIVSVLGEQGVSRAENGWTRIVVEKPFGHDLDSARMLNESLRTVFEERQIYRIDHYLAKETVQNIF